MATDNETKTPAGARGPERVRGVGDPLRIPVNDLGARHGGMGNMTHPVKNDPGIQPLHDIPDLPPVDLPTSPLNSYGMKPFPPFNPYAVSPAALIGLVIETRNGMQIQVAAASADMLVHEMTTLIGSATLASVPWLFSDVVAVRTPYSPLPPYGGEIVWRRPHGG